MITLPDTFDVSTLFADFFGLAAPFAGIALLISCGFLIINMMKKF